MNISLCYNPAIAIALTIIEQIKCKKEVKYMIVWIDGVNGVGKSHVAEILAKHLTYRNAKYAESDLYWMDLIQNEFPKALSWLSPYCNKFFLINLSESVEEKSNNWDRIQSETNTHKANRSITYLGRCCI